MIQWPRSSAPWVGAVLALMVWPADTVAQELLISPADSPLVVTGLIDDDTHSFSADLRVTLTGNTQSAELRILPSDLRSEDDPPVILRRNEVGYPQDITLTRGQPRDLRVTVNNVNRPGDYRGTLTLLLGQQLEAQGKTVPVMLDVEARPSIQATPTNLTVQAVRPSQRGFVGRAEAFLVRLLLPERLRHREWGLSLENLTLSPASLTGASLLARGEGSGRQLGAADVSVVFPPTLPPRGVGAASVALGAATGGGVAGDSAGGAPIGADRYQGSLRFTVEGADDPVSMDFTLDVRTGPLWPLLIVFLGVLLGRVVQLMQSPKTQMQMRLLSRYHAASELASELDPNSESRRYIDGELANIKRRIDRGEEEQAVLTQAMRTIELKIDSLLDLKRLKVRVEALSDSDPRKPELVKQLGLARVAVFNDDMAAFKAAVDAINKALGSAGLATMAAELSAVGHSGERLESNLREPIWRQRALQGALRAFGLLVGFNATTRAELQYNLLRPTLFVFLLVLLSLIGFHTLYVSGAPTFGANGLFDYLGLALWGLAADVAQRTLSNLPTMQP
jgi:hypothetical protein